MLNRADAGARVGGMTMSAEHHEVGAGRVAGEHPGGKIEAFETAALAAASRRR
jgi:hypothetical protein